MYGYVKQPDGVLKPILLKGIKNIIVSGDSLNIIYFQTGASPLNVLKVNQETYRTTGNVVVCDGTPVNGNYTLTGGNLVSGDIKLSFGANSSNILDIFTNWMNSILSGKVAATTDKTLNEYAPQLEIGYVFGNTGTIPTALAMPVPEGQDACTASLVVAESKTVYVAWDLQVDILPPVHTQLFEILFNDTDGTASFTPLNSGDYVLYQFIAPIPGLPDPEGPPQDIECLFDNALQLSMPENIIYPVTVVAGGITSITTCPLSIQATFSSYDTANNKCMEMEAYTQTSCNSGSLCPSTATLEGETIQSWEYYWRQGGSDFSINTNVNFAWQPNQPELISCTDRAIIPSKIGTSLPQSSELLNAGWRINPTTGSATAYPRKAIDGCGIEIFEYPEFGLQGVGMNVYKTPAGQITVSGEFTQIIDVPEIHICNGIPVTLDNKWRLNPNMLSKQQSLLYTDGAQGSGELAPPYWIQGIPPITGAANSTNYMWVTDKGLNIRPVLGAGGPMLNGRTDWNTIWNLEIRDAMREAGLIPPAPAPFAGGMLPGPGEAEVVDGPTQLSSKLRFWWRNYIPPKNVYNDYVIYNPAIQSETGLPPFMTKDTFTNGPFSPAFDAAYAQFGGIVPFIVEETYQPFLDAGFTHRAFMIGTLGEWDYNFMTQQFTTNFNDRFALGAAARQIGNNGMGNNPAVINDWRLFASIKNGNESCS